MKKIVLVILLVLVTAGIGLLLFMLLPAYTHNSRVRRQQQGNYK